MHLRSRPRIQSGFRFRGATCGFTLVELLVVIGIIALLIALLVPSLFAVTGASARTDSVKRMKQIGQWMHLYSSEHRQTIVPSRFDYSNDPYRGKVRSQSSDAPHTGTWTDILWALYAEQSFPEAVTQAGHDYTFDSPDNELYDMVPDYDGNPFRAAEKNSRGDDKRYPGYFAANDFFNADPDDPDFNGWWTEGQIRDPAVSLYAIDTWQGGDEPFTGEWIPDQQGYWGTGNGLQTPWVDYRYTGDALILFLDGHVGGESEVDNLMELQTTRKVKVEHLDR